VISVVKNYKGELQLRRSEFHRKGLSEGDFVVLGVFGGLSFCCATMM